MTDPHVVTALVKKRAQLAGDIKNTQAKLRQMVLNLEHVDQTLLLFDPDYQIQSIKPHTFRPPEDWSKRGEMSRLILEILRRTKEPMTSKEIAVQMIKERALDSNDKKLARLMTKRCGVALRGLRDRNVTVSETGPGQCVLWRL